MKATLSLDVLKNNVLYDKDTGIFTRTKNHPKRNLGNLESIEKEHIGAVKYV